MKYFVITVAAVVCFIQLVKLIDEIRHRKKEKENKNDGNPSGND